MEYIYLHGFLSGPSSSKGEFLFKQFGESGIYLHRPDLNGDDFEHLTITSQLDIIGKLLDSLPGEVTMLGSSLGGYLAGVAAERWSRIDRLVLMAPAFDFVHRYLGQLSKTELREWKEIGFINLYQYHYQEHRRLRYGIVEDAQKYRDFSMDRQLPVQILHGICDESVPYDVSVEYLKNHSGAELVLLNTDHGLLDKLPVMWEYIKTFLDL
ncbi:MAG: YqiA/YcfP family alpha/beta fold hydrolase [Calditrichia bacterium]